MKNYEDQCKKWTVHKKVYELFLEIIFRLRHATHKRPVSDSTNPIRSQYSPPNTC